ncbi:hypothetical protein HN51_039939, partial [Arachis hypogaea]
MFSFRGVDLDALLDMSTDEVVKLFTIRARRRFQRGLTHKPMALIKKLRKAGEGGVEYDIGGAKIELRFCYPVLLKEPKLSFDMFIALKKVNVTAMQIPCYFHSKYKSKIFSTYTDIG